MPAGIAEPETFEPFIIKMLEQFAESVGDDGGVQGFSRNHSYLPKRF